MSWTTGPLWRRLSRRTGKWRCWWNVCWTCHGSGRGSICREEVALDRILLGHLEEQRNFGGTEGVEVNTNIVSNAVVSGERGADLGGIFQFAVQCGQVCGKGRVEIALTPRDGRYCFGFPTSFAGNGPGAHLGSPSMWESSRNQALTGTGLGLPMVKKIAERCGYQTGCGRDGSRSGLRWF